MQTDRRSSEANSGRKKWRLKSIFSWSRKDRRAIGDKAYSRLHDSGIEDVSKDFVNLTARSSFQNMRRVGSFAVTEDRFTEGSIISDVEDDRSCLSCDESLQEGFLVHRLVTCADRSTQTDDNLLEKGMAGEVSFVRIALMPFVFLGLLILHLVRDATREIVRFLTPTVRPLMLESYWQDLGVFIGTLVLPFTPVMIIILVIKRAFEWRPTRPTIPSSPLQSRTNPFLKIFFIFLFPFFLPFFMCGNSVKQLKAQKSRGPIAPPRLKRQGGVILGFFRWISSSSSRRSVSSGSGSVFPRLRWNKGARPHLGKCPCKCVIS